MKFHKKTALALSAIGLFAASAASFAVPELKYTTTLGPTVITVDPFDAFDWNSAGAAVTDGFVADNSTVFSTEFWADAIGIKSGANTIAGNLAAAGVAGGAEFTIHAMINETANPVSASTAEFTTAPGGTWAIYYEPTANANLVTGAGITDGTVVMSGTIVANQIAGSFTANASGGGTGTFAFNATVGFTNNDFINPDLARSLAVSTIQFGTSRTDGSEATGVPGAGGASAPLPTGDGVLIFQADANQSFSVVPVPATVLLIGLGMLGLSRRMARI